MTVTIDHVGILAVDPEASARFLGEILGEGRVTSEGPDGDMFNLSVGQRTLTYFEAQAHDPLHIAFRVTQEVFLGAITRLGSQGVPFGNNPEDPSNMQTTDPQGSVGRVYFRDPNGHLFELFIPGDSGPQGSL